MGFIHRLCLIGWGAACSVAPTLPGTDEPPSSSVPTCTPGVTCPPPGEFRECFSAQASCRDGNVTGVYGYNCAAYTARCELGCRQDVPSGTLFIAQGISRDDAVASGERSCEEYRIERGARRPGDNCGSDFDCLPFPPGTPKDGEPWPGLMSCVGGACREQAPELPSDFGAPCTPAEPLGRADAYGQLGIVVAGSCERGVCNIRDAVEADPGRCTMQCSDDSSCPPGTLCSGVSIGTILDLYTAPGARVCLEPLSATETATPDASSADAGSPDAG